jgi:hypothetical protein
MQVVDLEHYMSKKFSEFNFGEIGNTGLKRSYGYVLDEFLASLRGSRGRKIYREMADNDAIVGAMLFAISQILRESRWDIKPGDEKVAECKKDAEFLKDSLFGMKHSWAGIITDILSFFVYGFSLFEQVFYRRNDGKIVWSKLAFRSQDSLERWDFDDYGETLGFWQRPAPDYHEFYIPITKCLHFRTQSAGNNPEGRSILRNAFRAWFMKKNIEEIEAIGIERDLAGLPMMTLPEGFDPTSTDPIIKSQLASAKTLVTNIRRDEQEGILMPFGWKLELLTSGGKRQIDTVSVINRYNKEIAVTTLAQFIMLGMERTGSYALAAEQTDMFYLALEAWADYIGTVMNRYAVPTLFKVNGISGRPLPYFVHTPIRRFTLTDIANYVSKLTDDNVKALDITDETKAFLKRYGRLEEFSEVRR